MATLPFSIESHPGQSLALSDSQGTCDYALLRQRIADFATRLLEGRPSLAGQRVAFLIPPSVDYAVTLLAIWRAGGIAVPLCIAHPPAEMAYVIEDAQVFILVGHPEFEGRLRPLATRAQLPYISTTEIPLGPLAEAAPVSAADGALIIYTSGTTSKPKGALSSHGTLAAQTASLIEAWEWSAEDRTTCVLPLHHVHGVVNVLLCGLRCGARIDLERSFTPERVWQGIANGEMTLFMAVPTIYTRLISFWEQANAAEQEKLSAACKRLRLMVSGSAALPVPVFEKWHEISGHDLLERYGMTEIGMALSNLYRGKRVPGHVGFPLPGVQVRLCNEQGEEVSGDAPGEIQIRGDTVFSGYWNRPDITASSFTPDGWFRSGDVAILTPEGYRILGRNSVDIIKTGGYKVSALEIEEVLLGHPAIEQCAVVGIEDEQWGERVAAAIVVKAGESLDLPDLRSWASARLAVYKIPSLLLCPAELPRNAMGKVMKPLVKKLFAGKEAPQKQPKPSSATMSSGCPGPSKLTLVGSSIFAQWPDPALIAPSLTVVNRAIGGTTAADWISRLPAVLKEEQPDLLFMYLGSNDINHGKSADNILKDIQSCRDLLQKHRPHCRLVYFGIILAPQKLPHRAKVEAINAGVSKLLQTHDLFIDSNTIFLREGSPIASYFREDDLHLTEQAYEAMTQHCAEALTEALLRQGVPHP